MTLIEVVFGMAILGLLAIFIGAIISLQADLFGKSGDQSNTVRPAAGALDRIRDELRSAVNTTNAGISATPAYSCRRRSITFRRAQGFGDLGDSSLVSEWGVRYEPYVTTIAYDPVAFRVTLTRSGTVPAGMPASEVLCGPTPANPTAPRVTDFMFFDAMSTASPPEPASDATDITAEIIGIRIVVTHPSAMPNAKGVAANSSFPMPNGGAVNAYALQTKVRVLPEIIDSSETLPAVGP